MLKSLLWFALIPVGCIDSVTQVAGTGAIYSTKCSGEMEVRGGQYYVQCDPPTCDTRFKSSAINHVVVSLDPGRKIIGYSERICVQDLAESSGLFNPAMLPPEPVEATPSNSPP